MSPHNINEQSRKYFNFGAELIFWTLRNFFASVTSTMMHAIVARSSPLRRRADTKWTQLEHASSTRRVAKLFCDAGCRISGSGRCDLV
jgi:hypothetical protein